MMDVNGCTQRRLHVFAGIVLLSLSFACSRTTEAPADDDAPTLTPVILFTDWLAEAEHGGFYLARLRGYYREQGIDLKIQSSATPVNAYHKVASNDVQFALGTSDNLIVAMSRGVPVVGVVPYFQRDPQGVMFRRDQNIRSLRDLDGRRVKISAGLHYVEYLQRTLGIKLQLVPMDGSTAQFVAEEDLIQQCFLTNEPWVVAQAGVDVDVLPFWDMELDPYRLVLTSREIADTQPDLVRRFVTATLRGWSEYAAGDTTDTFAEIASLNPAMSPEFLKWAWDRMQAFGIVHGKGEAGETLGQIRLARLDRQISQLAGLDLLDKPVTASDVMMLEGYPPHLLIDGMQDSSGSPGIDAALITPSSPPAADAARSL